MFAGLPVALALAAQAAAEVPATAPSPPDAAKTADDACAAQRPSSDREIVICAERPNGYRIDPDILTVKRAKRSGRPPSAPHRMGDTSCKVVGPAGCIARPGIDMLAAAATVAKMADRLAKGEEIGSMFVTNPQPSEYQLYKEAKARREAEEAEKAAKAKAKTAPGAREN
jgi:hypothetical protein